jgi:transcriptional regulator with XRE-family HTH domain
LLEILANITMAPAVGRMVNCEMDEFSDLSPGALKRYLRTYGRSQAALAAFMGLDVTAVSKIVNGKRQLKAHEADKIREYLNNTTEPVGDAHSPSASEIDEANRVVVQFFLKEFTNIAAAHDDTSLLIDAYDLFCRALAERLSRVLPISEADRRALSQIGRLFTDLASMTILARAYGLIDEAQVRAFGTIRRLRRASLAKIEGSELSAERNYAELRNLEFSSVQFDLTDRPEMTRFKVALAASIIALGVRVNLSHADAGALVSSVTREYATAD